ncbi:MAG TPA: response regulator transcription factor [Polyangia bacterium]|jgi:DNA-binding response OmpR family regulator|nr:response regulator transcription factor [Polyangia bacterium]
MELCNRLRAAFARDGSAVRVVDRLGIWSRGLPEDAMLLHAANTASAARWCRVVRRAHHIGALIACCDTVEPAGVAGVLDAGADDVVASRVADNELLARVRAVCRRHSVQTVGQTRVGPIVVDAATREAAISGTPVTLRRTEFRLLSYLLANSDRVVGAHELMRDVLGSENTEDTALIRVHLSQLRRKLGSAGHAIETIRGQGYRLSPGEAELAFKSA